MFTQDQLIRNINNYVKPSMAKVLYKSHKRIIKISKDPLVKYEQKLLMDMCEQEAEDFTMVLSIALLFYNEEDICDFLDGLKHLIIGKQ